MERLFPQCVVHLMYAVPPPLANTVTTQCRTAFFHLGRLNEAKIGWSGVLFLKNGLPGLFLVYFRSFQHFVRFELGSSEYNANTLTTSPPPRSFRLGFTNVLWMRTLHVS